jgi:hypothetical protein
MRSGGSAAARRNREEHKRINAIPSAHHYHEGHEEHEGEETENNTPDAIRRFHVVEVDQQSPRHPGMVGKIVKF